MKKLNILIRIITNLGFWLLLYLINYTQVRNEYFNPVHQLLAILFHAFIFYLNYYILMPLLFNKKVLLFISLSIILLSVTLYFNYTFQNNYFEKVKPQYISQTPEIQRNINPTSSFEYRLHKPRSKINKRIMFSAYGLFLFYLLGFAMRFVKKWQDDERNKSEFEKEKVKTELLFLKQQINPHFLFNTLNSIYSLSISKSENTTGSILKLSSILRYMLYESEESKVSLKDEIRVLQDYIDLQRLRLTDKVSLSLLVEGNPYGIKIEQFILIPLIENAFKYGVDSVYDSFIDTRISITNNVLELKLLNKIVQISASNKNESGIGLKNVKRRLELLYPGNYEFTSGKIDDNVFKVHLIINLGK